MRFPEYVIHVEQNWQVPVEGLLNIQAPTKLAQCDVLEIQNSEWTLFPLTPKSTYYLIFFSPEEVCFVFR